MKKTFLSLLIILAGITMLRAEVIDVTLPKDAVSGISGFGSAPRRVRIEVLADGIAHISATAAEVFKDKKSLIIVPQTTYSDYSVKESDGVVTIKTSRMSVSIVKSTGEVCVTDNKGRTVIKELQGGGKSFRPYECTQIHSDGTPETYHGWSMQTVFENVHPQEAIYGLGQHQADEWNYKGRNEELFQYNTKVSIPFFVSSEGYGVLFDNYSLSRFGNPLDYSQLNHLFTLHDKDGEPGALTGTYSAPGIESLVRREDSIYFENLKSARNLPRYNLGKAIVVYEGTITPHVSGEYRFSHYYSGYQKVFIDGRSVYTENLIGSDDEAQEIWRTAWNPNSRKFSMRLEAGRAYPIRIEWRPDGGEAYCGLRALAPVSENEQQRLSMYHEMGQQLDYYVIVGERGIDDVIAGYRQLTGKAPIMPEWLLGYWQSRERYKTQDEILDALRGFRSRRLPIDNIVMDWNYWKPNSWGAFTFEPERFPSPKGMIDSIHASHAKIMISCWPKYYLNVDNFKELNDKGLIYQQSVRDSLYDWLGYKYAFYDAYDKEARRIFWRQLYERLGTIGMDAWWMDASEPNVRDCTDMDYRKLLCGPTAYGSSDEFFNAYSIVNAEAIYDGQRAYETAIEQGVAGNEDSKALQERVTWNEYGYGNSFSPENKRVFLLTRNGFASEQRYSTATWSGDIGTRWEDMKAQITAGLNFSISGVPYWSQDIGGFSVENRYAKAQREYEKSGKETADLREWRELNVRWHQWGMFTPMYRAHGQYPYREPWNIAPEGHPAYESIKKCLDLRYRLMSYLYSLAASVHFNDYTIMRPLVMDFPKDTTALLTAYQYMFGPAIMVCPVFRYGERMKEVYVPKGSMWYDFRTGQLLSEHGGETLTLSAPYEGIPLLIRGGSIVPFGPRMEYTREKQAEELLLYVYAGANGEFTLYEDEGVNYGYEAGRYAKIPLRYDDEKKSLTIGNREGEFPGMLRERKFTVVYCTRNNPRCYAPDASGFTVSYSGKEKTIRFNKR